MIAPHLCLRAGKFQTTYWTGWTLMPNTFRLGRLGKDHKLVIENKYQNRHTKPYFGASNRLNMQTYQSVFREILPPEVVYAGEYLESRGLLLGDDFGTTNAIRKATDMILDELEVDYGV